MKRALCLMLMAAVCLAGRAASASNGPLCEMSDAEIVDLMIQWNAGAAEAGLNVEVAEIACFVFGVGRPPVRIHQQPFRWVPGDPRRVASGNDITFMLDSNNNPGPSSPLVVGYPTAALTAAMGTWDADKCLKKVDLLPVPSVPAGTDATIFDADFLSGPTFGFCPGADVGVPGDGNPFLADIVDAGWYPDSCFGFGTLAFSVTFTFTGTDINGDNYRDTALNEVYWNDAWGNPGLPVGDPRIGFPWDDTNPGSALPSIDVQTVGFHEYGHSLGIGHFGPPPAAVMNPVYAGPRRSTFPIDHAGMCAVWGSWPNP